MHVWVTRPGDLGVRLTQKLQQNNITASNFPVFDFKLGKDMEICEQVLNLLPQDSYVFIVSAQAASMVDQYFTEHNGKWAKNVRYIAPGRNTAEHIAKLTATATDFPAFSESSEGVIAMDIMRPEIIKNKQILILNALGGRDLLANYAKQNKADVLELAVYARTKLFADDNFLKIQSLIDTIIVTSSEILCAILDFTTKNQHNHLKNCNLIVCSARLKELAHELGFNHIYMAKSAAQNDILDRLLSLRCTDKVGENE